MFHFLCAFIVLFIVISMVWPSPRKKQAEADRKHKELLAVISNLERQVAARTPAAPPLPKYDRAYRARVLALGRARDGDKRHPILDTPYASVANPRQT